MPEGTRSDAMPTKYTGGLHTNFVAALAIALATLTACGGDDARDTREEVADAQEQAAEHVAEAQSDAAEAGRDVDARAAAAYDVAVAQAEGAHSVAVERCDALAGDARRSCRERADADLQLAKSRAKQARDSST
jgi:hypothetical protein